MTITEWKKIMTDDFIANETIKSAYGLVPGKTFEEQFSKVSIESIFFYVVAACLFFAERFFAKKEEAINDRLDNMRPHQVKWYINKIKDYQHGYSLPEDSDRYVTIDEDAKIIKHCAIVEAQGLIIKIAGDEGSGPVPISNEILENITEYINRIKDAGVHFVVESRQADSFKCDLLIHYDPLILDSNGCRLDGETDTPVQEAIQSYISAMSFNGMYSNMALIDAVQKVEGVKIAQLTSAKVKFGLSSNYEDIVSIYTPDAGYMNLEEINLTFRPY